MKNIYGYSTSTDAPYRKTQRYFTKQIMDRHMKNIYGYNTRTDAPYSRHNSISPNKSWTDTSYENIYGYSTWTHAPYRKTQ